jgi:hypothetical protein
MGVSFAGVFPTDLLARHRDFNRDLKRQPALVPDCPGHPHPWRDARVRPTLAAKEVIAMRSTTLRTRLVLAVYGAATLGTLLYTIGAPWRAS